jgi:hypothetical protein
MICQEPENEKDTLYSVRTGYVYMYTLKSVQTRLYAILHIIKRGTVYKIRYIVHMLGKGAPAVYLSLLIR